MPNIISAIPSLFTELSQAQWAAYSERNPSEYEKENRYFSAFSDAIKKDPQEVTESLLWDLAITFADQDIYLTAQNYLHVALRAPKLYGFIKSKADCIEVAKHQEPGISDMIISALRRHCKDRMLVTCNMLDHYLAEYLFELNYPTYQKKFISDPKETQAITLLVTELTNYGARNAFAALHEIYAHGINEAKNLAALEAILKGLDSMHDDEQFTKKFHVGGHYHLFALYTHGLSKFNHLALTELNAEYSRRAVNLKEALYSDSTITLHAKLTFLEKKAMALADTLDSLFTAEQENCGIYAQNDLNEMRKAYESSFRPLIKTKTNQPTKIFQRNVDALYSRNLSASGYNGLSPAH